MTMTSQEAKALHEGQALRDLREHPGGRLILGRLADRRTRALEELATCPMQRVRELQAKIKAIDELMTDLRIIDEQFERTRKKIEGESPDV